MLDLTTNYLGLHLENPLVVSASPLSKRLDTVKRLEEAGAGALVVYSLFEEQITHDSLELNHYLDLGTHSYAESLSYFPDLENYNLGPERYLEHLHRIKESVTIPVIGSLNGVSSGGWVEYARKIEEAGADALELNIYYVPTSPDVSGVELEATYLELVSEVCRQVEIPVAVKLSPFFTSLPNMARRIVEAGAAGLVLFNRFYQPDLDIEKLEVVPSLELSTSSDLRLPLRWVAILFGRIQADLALTSGVHTREDALKAVMAGARVTMLAASLIANGPAYLTTLLSGMCQWMEDHEYTSITQMWGSMSQLAVADPAAFERANYMKALNTFDHSVAL
ncbi:MAG: dihydroorotate dehydrogenase-like protein [Ktedonobacterales bacterium]